MGKTQKPNLVETDSKATKAKSAKGAPKARKVRGRTINRRRERAMRKALKATEKKHIEYLELEASGSGAQMDAAMALENLKDQVRILEEAHARNIARMTLKK